MGRFLSLEELDKIHRYWQAANYLSVGQIYLKDNPLLKESLKAEHIKPRLLGHFGTSPGLNLIYAHLNRLIKEHDANVIYVCGPGHGGPALISNVYLEGTYSEEYSNISEDTHGMLRLFKQFSTPGGVPSHVSPHCPGSIHEGGELGYCLVHAYGAAFDNPDLIVTCVVGDGEAETGPCEGGWKGNKFLNPERDGAVLPILHLNGYKISGPTVLARISDEELLDYFKGHGYTPFLVEGEDPMEVHQDFAETLENCYQQIRDIQNDARENGFHERPRWPMIILRTPKGWTGPKFVDGLPVEGTFRAHQVPLANVRSNPEHLQMLEEWMRSYQPEKHFNENGTLIDELKELTPKGKRRMGANPHANGGDLLIDLSIPDYTEFGIEVPSPGSIKAEAPRHLGNLIREIIKRNPHNFRLFCPDETNSNRLGACFEATDRCSTASIIDIDDHVGPEGRVMEVLSEHCCQGWLEGYLLTGRHGIFPTYEAFASVVDSMLNQHAKWLKTIREIPWRHPVASCNYLLTSHAWRNDHNGYSHQGPGFIDNVLSKKGSVTRAYFPPDTNCLLSVADHCFRSRNYVNLIVAGKQQQPQWLTMDQAREHCSKGISRWDFASNDNGVNPDVILGCAGDVPTIETIAAAWLLRKHLPELRVRVVNVVDLMTLALHTQHPHGIDEIAFDELFTRTQPVIFAFHGYPRIIHDLIHSRPHQNRFHVHGYMEEGTTTTPFDMVVLNHMSRYHLAIDALSRISSYRSIASDLIEMFEEKLQEHHFYIRDHLEDMPEIRDWTWSEPVGDRPLQTASTWEVGQTD
ncbi:MAG: phosphoketolase family protein [Chlamydiota bacterium]